MDEDLLTFNPTTIQNRIYTLRGLQIMLDIDLAQIYGVKSIRLREQVKRNIRRFPSDFMFQLNENEVDFMVSQNAIPSKKLLGGSLPWVFTEQGVSNLSSVLNSDHAIDTNIVIMPVITRFKGLGEISPDEFKPLYRQRYAPRPGNAEKGRRRAGFTFVLHGQKYLRAPEFYH